MPVRDPNLHSVQVRLGVMPLLLNALDGVSCLPSLTTSYPEDTVPFGPFSGGGGGHPGYDVIGSQVDRLTPEAAAELMPLLRRYEERSQPERERLEFILFRLCQAKRHSRVDDKVLDLGITLEMLLLDDNSQHDQLSLTFRLRGAWLLGPTTEERECLYRDFRDIYNARSAVAHGGTLLRNGDGSRIRACAEALPHWLNLAARVFRKLLLEGRPDWTKLILHGRTDTAP